MVKGIFVFDQINQSKIKIIKQLTFDSVFISDRNLDVQSVHILKKSGFKVLVETGVFNQNLCPNDRAVQQEKLNKIGKIVKNLEIDGLWLDFIRFPARWEGEGRKLINIHHCSKCERLETRTTVINSFVAQVRDLIDQANKRVSLGMFSVPLKESELDGAIAKVFGQDFEILAEYIDVFTPMTYHKFCDRDVAWIAEMVGYMTRVTKKPVLPIIQTEDRAGKINKQEFQESIKFALQKPSKGVIVFFLEDLLKDGQKVLAVESLFGQ